LHCYVTTGAVRVTRYHDIKRVELKLQKKHVKPMAREPRDAR